MTSASRTGTYTAPVTAVVPTFATCAPTPRQPKIPSFESVGDAGVAGGVSCACAYGAEMRMQHAKSTTPTSAARCPRASIIPRCVHIELRQCIKREKEFPLGIIIRSQKRHTHQGIARVVRKTF